MMNLLYTVLALDGMAGFSNIRRSLAGLVAAIFGIFAIVSFVVTIICVMEGDREGAKKIGKWFAVTTLFYILISVIKNL